MGEKEKERKRKKVVDEENVEGLEEEGHEVVVEGQAGVGQHRSFFCAASSVPLPPPTPTSPSSWDQIQLRY